jgi:predicted nucleic acid-binding protein
MKLFIDTSALIKYFHQEQGSKRIEELMSSEINEIWISELAVIEFKSALYRLFRNNEINEEELNSAIQGFDEYLQALNIEPLRRAIIIEAELLIKNYGKNFGIRTLDALQAGTFNLIADKEWRFVCSDVKLCNLVKEFDFSVINPVE